MRIAFLFACLNLLACLSPVAFAQQASIEGTIIDITSHQPTPGVHVTMFSVAKGMPEHAFGAMSDKSGHFSITGLKPATYLLTAQKPGFAPLSGSNTSLTMKPGEIRTGVTLEMAPATIVSGTVTDEFGDPVPRVRISSAAASPAQGETMMSGGMNGSMNGTTDERGQFRIHGLPGKYYISATPNPQFTGGPAETRADGSKIPAWAVTWYPSVPDKTAAAIVDAKPGKELTGVDIRLVSHRSVGIHGSVSGVPTGSNRRANILLWAAGEGPQQFRDVRFATPEQDGKFSFTGLAPGQYTALARLDDNGVSWRSALRPVRLDAADFTDLDIPLSQGAEFSGTLEGLPASKRTIALEAAFPLRSFGVNNTSAQVATDGSFRLTAVFPGKQKVIVAPLPENAYVKSVRVDSTEFTDGTVEIPAAPGAHIKVLLSDKAASLEGTLLSADGKPLTDTPFIYVFLATSPDDLSFQSAKQSTGEHYSLKGIRPGKYRLMAINPVENGAMPEALRAVFDKAEQIEIKEGDRLTHDLKLSATEVPHAK
jgi:hypothetical protein